jgi:deoxyribodipyrimidine photolyase-like uncharacterized protein
LVRHGQSVDGVSVARNVSALDVMRSRSEASNFYLAPLNAAEGFIRQITCAERVARQGRVMI